MYELPLFPLNTVLFPGTPVHLHIFENRYIQMVNHCLEQNQLFGVVLIREGVEAFGPLAVPFSVGCSAEIIKVEELPEGRKDIVAIGKGRFRVLSVDRKSRPYLIGEVEEDPIRVGDEATLRDSAEEIRTWLERYLKAMAMVIPAASEIDELTEDPLTLIYLAAALLQVPSEEKQALLEMDDTQRLVDAVQAHYRREVALLRATRGLAPGKGSEPFSRN
jgi:Lon protease-like protein